MRRYAKFSLLAVILVASAFAGRFQYTTPEAAALSCPEIQECIDNGYVMDSCVEQPIYYFIPPTGTYEWGQVNIRMSQFCLPPIYITCNIEARDRNNRMMFRETHNTVVQ